MGSGLAPAFAAIALAVLAGVGIYLCYRLALPCIPSLAWAGALGLVFAPLHERIEARVRRPALAAAVSLAIIGLLVVAPATWFAHKLAEQLTLVPQSIQKQIAAGKWHMAGDAYPQVARIVGLVEQEVSQPENASRATSWLKTTASSLIKESAIAALQVCLTLYFLFYFLRDRVRVLKVIRSFSPLTESETDTLFGRVNDTVHATLYGMLALSALQGLLGGLMFWWLGVPSPWFWALVAAVFAFVPVVDTIVLWLPAAVYLGLEGRWGEALGVAALGSRPGPRARELPLSGAGEASAEGPVNRYLHRPSWAGCSSSAGVDSCLGRWFSRSRPLCSKSAETASVSRKLAVRSPDRPRIEAVNPHGCGADAGERVPICP